MRSRTSLALAGALLVTLVPGAAMAAPGTPSGIAVAVAIDDAPVTMDDALDDATEVVDDPITIGAGWPELSDPDPVLTEPVTDGLHAPDDLGNPVSQAGVVDDDPGDQPSSGTPDPS